MECSARLPPLAAGELEAELVRRAGVPPSRRQAVESLLDSVEEVLASQEPIVVFVVGEWGEGKTAAWHAFVKPRLLERGAKILEARAAALAETLERASWIASPGWRLVAALYGLEKGSIPGDYRQVASALDSTVVFVDEVEDLTYRRGALEAFLEGIHAVIDGEPGVRLHFYLSVSPTAYAKIASWYAWRRLRRRIRLVELKPLSKSELIDALRAMLDYACSGCMPVEDPRLLNALVAASNGNLGALAGYVRRLLAAWLRRGCRPLSIDDVERILLESLPAGLAAAGINPGVLGQVGREALLVVGVDLGEYSLEAVACEARRGLVADNVWLDEKGRVVILDGVWAEEAAELGWRVARCEAGGVRVKALRPQAILRVYGGRGTLADFIPEPSLREEALRAAFADARLAAAGLASLVCRIWACRACTLGDDGVALLEARVHGVAVRVAILPPGSSGGGEALSLTRWKPHVVVTLGGRLPRGTWRSIELELDPATLLQLGALGYLVSRRGCGREDVDEDRLALLASHLETRYRLTERLVEAISGHPPLLVKQFNPPLPREKLRCLVHVAAALPGASVDEVSERASSFCGIPKHRVDHALRALVAAGVFEAGRGVRVRLSESEEAILAMLSALGGVARLSELQERLIPEGGWDSKTLAWIYLLAWKGVVSAPSRLTPRSRIRFEALDSLRERVRGLKPPDWVKPIEECGGDELCERAWLVAVEWLASRKREGGEATPEHKEAHAGEGLVAVEIAYKSIWSPTAASGEMRSEHPASTLHQSGRAQGVAVSDARLWERLEKRLLEALRAVPAARESSRLEELAEAVMLAKKLAREGKLEDAVAILNDTLVSIARHADSLLVETAKRLDPRAYEAISMLLEDGYAARRALERLTARSIAELVEKSVELAQAKLLRAFRAPPS